MSVSLSWIGLITVVEVVVCVCVVVAVVVVVDVCIAVVVTGGGVLQAPNSPNVNAIINMIQILNNTLLDILFFPP
jgi:hypothetical protein